MTPESFDTIDNSDLTPELMNHQFIPYEDSEVESAEKLNLTGWFLGILSLLLLITGCYLVFRQFDKPQPQQNNQLPQISLPEKTNLTVKISANGTVEPEKIVNLSPKVSGLVKELFVEEGNIVKKGQIIAKMDDSNLQGQLIEAQGKVAQAEANLEKLIAGNRPQEIAQAQAKLEELQANLAKLIAGNRNQEIAQSKARVRSANAVLAQAEDELQRNQLLYDEGAISRQSLNEKITARDVAKASVLEAEEELSLVKEGTRTEEIAQARAEVKSQQETVNLLKEGTRTEEIAQARAELNSMRGTLKTIQTSLEDTIIKAPFDGIIAFIYADPGAFVTPTTSGSSVSSATSSSILSIISKNEVIANIPEKNIAQIKIGQKVLISADAFTDQTFEGKVSKIATQATVEQNVTSFEVTVSLIGEKAHRLRAGMNISADFQVGQKEDVLTVPTIAVTRKDNVTGVFVGEPNQPPRFVPITIGATVDDQTEVKSGLNGNEHILTNVSNSPPPPPSSGFSLRNLFGGLGGNNRPDGPPPPPNGSPPPQ